MILVLLTTLAHAGLVSLQPGDDIRAKTQGLGPGDEILFADGVYEIEGTIQWMAPGTAESPITIKARDHARPVIRVLSGSAVAELVDSSHVTIRGLTFEGGEGWEEASYVGLRIRESHDVTVVDSVIRNVSSTAIRVEGNGSGLTLTGNHLSYTASGSGIYAGCSDASCWLQDSVIQGNLIHDLGGDNVTGIRLEPGAQNVEVLDNVIFRVATGGGGRGISTNSTEFGPPNVIQGNIVWHATGDGIWLEGPARVRNNIVFQVDGVGIGSRNNSRDGLTDLVISFNTVVDTGSYGVHLQDWFHRDGMVFANNAVANPTGYAFEYSSSREEGDITSNYISRNHVTGLARGFSQDEYPGWVVPGGGFSDFVDVDDWDFYPRQGSPLVNGADEAGEAWVPSVDFNGTPRQGDAPDVGAYEWDRGGNPGWTVQEGFKELGPGTRSGAHDISSGCCGGNKSRDAVLVLPVALFGWLRRRRRA